MLAAAEAAAAARLESLRMELLSRVEESTGLEATRVVQAAAGDRECAAAWHTAVEQLAAQHREAQKAAAKERDSEAARVTAAMSALREELLDAMPRRAPSFDEPALAPELEVLRASVESMGCRLQRTEAAVVEAMSLGASLQEELRSGLDGRLSAAAAAATRRILDETAPVLPTPARDVEDLHARLATVEASVHTVQAGAESKAGDLESVLRAETGRWEAALQAVTTSVAGMQRRSEDLASDLARLRADTAALADEEVQTQRAVSSLREDVASEAAKGAAASAAAASIASRVAALEHGAVGGAEPGVAALAQLEDRVAAADTGLARLCGELRDHGRCIEEVQAEQRSLSEDLRGRLQVLIEKVDHQCQQGVSIGSQHSFASSSTRFVSETIAAPRLLGGQANLPIKALGQPLTLPRSQSCGELPTPRDPADDEATSVLQALREENLRLREANLEIRELAVQAKGVLAPASKLAPAPAPPAVVPHVQVSATRLALQSPVLRMRSVPHTVVNPRPGAVAFASTAIPMRYPAPVVVRGAA